MYCCTVNGNSRTMICTLSSAHWQRASKLSGCLSRFRKIDINAPINILIIIIIIVIIIMIIIIIIITYVYIQFTDWERVLFCSQVKT